MRINIILFKVFVILITLFSCSKKDHSADNNSTDDKATATILAEEKWLWAYGTSIYNEKPYSAKKVNDSIWIVTGTFSKLVIGGVAYAKVNVKSKKVINYTHGE